MKKMIGIAVALVGRPCRTPSFRSGGAMAKCQEMFESHFTREHALDEEPESLVPATGG